MDVNGLDGFLSDEEGDEEDVWGESETSSESVELDEEEELSLEEDDSDGFLDFEDGDEFDSIFESEETEEKEEVEEEQNYATEGEEISSVSGDDTVVYFTSSEEMTPVADESVDLIVTSPPYNADWAYGSHDDSMNYEDEYLPMLARVFEECWRVLSPTGRLCINVPSLLRGGAQGGQAIAADICTLLNNRSGPWMYKQNHPYKDMNSCRMNTDFVMREQIVWNKGFNTDGLAPNGSFPRPVGVLLNNMHEVILIFQKPGERSYDDMPDEVIENSKINKKNDDLCDDVWNIHPEDHDFQFAEEEDVPPFPKELPERCIRLWSYEGDTVLDPFNGRGTTVKAAKELGRKGIGFEIRESLARDIESYVGMKNIGLDEWM